MNVQRPVTALSLRLPTAGGRIETFNMSAPRDFPERVAGPLNRVALAAAHMVVDPLAEADPWLQVAPDWERTIAFREHLWDLGLGVAEAMDTAQRGMGLDWPTSLELIRRSVSAAKARGDALVFSGIRAEERGGRGLRGRLRCVGRSPSEAPQSSHQQDQEQDRSGRQQDLARGE